MNAIKRVVGGALLGLVLLVYQGGGFVNFVARDGKGVSTPTTQLKQTMADLEQVLNDKTLGKEEKRERLRAVVLHRFDLEETARRALGSHYIGHEARMGEFLPVFTKLLEHTYIAHVEFESITGTQIEYQREEIRGESAEVVTRVITKKYGRHAVHYRMHWSMNEWRVYAIMVEGVSLVSNYRSQFSAILARSSFDELLKKMRVRIEELKKKRR